MPGSTRPWKVKAGPAAVESGRNGTISCGSTKSRNPIVRMTSCTAAV
jgi:hypothetical protein